MPQFLFNRLKEIATDLWDGLQGYLIGLDDALVNKDDVIETAQYLYDMGYDLVGMGFAESVTIYGQEDEDGDMVEVTEGHVKNEIKTIDAPYLRAYLVAENRTYLINNYTFNLEDFGTSFFDGTFWDNGSDAWGTGLIDLDEGFLSAFKMIFDSTPVVGELTQKVKIDRSTNTMQIKRLNIGWKFWKAHIDYTYFNLEGWTGRYGKPFELLLTLHVATMSPDLVKEFAMNNDLDAKVHVKLKDTSFGGTVHINGTSIDDLRKVEHTHTDENGKEVIDYVDYTDGSQSYSEETVEGLRKIQKDRAGDVKTSIPYISSVTNHWFRNVYFEGSDSIGASGSTEIGIDTDDDGLENYNEKSGVKTQKSTTLSSGNYNAYNFGDDIEATLNYIDEDIEENVPGIGPNDKITLVGTMENGVVQVKDAVRGLTNQTTKDLFSKKYYIYDGTISRAKEIQKARSLHNESIKEKIDFTKNSLQAFTILEETETLDAQYIYRDLKELVIELGYFEKEDFYEIEKRVLEWPIPDYVPAEWPNKKVEKNVLEYGTLIACDETMANSLGISLDDLRRMTQTGDDDDNDNDDDDNEYESTLNNCTFIGDEYMIGLKDNTDLKEENFFVKEGATPQYWLNNIASLPSEPKTIIIYLGLNDLDDYKAAENLIDALLEKYENTRIYMLELLHLDKGYAKADSANKRIDTFNSHLREKCKVTKRTKFLNVSTGLVSAGYMINSDGSGTILADSEYDKFAKNIYYGIRDKRDVSSNPTDEEFVAKILEEAKDLSKYLKDNNFEYGTPDFIPAKSDGTTTEDGKKKISSDRYVSWVLYKAGCTDQGEEGSTTGKDGSFISYCESKEWTRIESIDSVQAGDIVFTGKIDNEGMKAQNVFICAGEGQRYECTSNSQIKNGDEQPVKKEIDSDFVCAYRVTGDGVINTGFKDGLDVTAMGNGRITEIYDDSNNIFADEALAKKLYGESTTIQQSEDEDTVEGREQTLQGLRIKLTDTALKGYVLVMYGFELEGNLSIGTEIHTGDVIGKTLDSDICLILIDRDKAVIENIEDYMKVPKKTKNKRTQVDWDFYYWLPYESGPLGEAGVPSDNGPGACGTVSGSDEIAVGIAQWTVYGSTNNIAPLCKWLAEEDPSLCGSLKAFANYSGSQFINDFGSLKAAWSSVNEKNTDRFLELQMQYFYDVDFTGWVKEAGVDWILDKDLVTQGTYASLKNWGPNLGWESVMDSSMSDLQIVKNLLTKALPIGSTCGTLETRWNSQYVLAKDILNGDFTEVENWIRKEEPGKYSTGQNPGALGTIKMYFRVFDSLYVADIKRTFLGGIYG